MKNNHSSKIPGILTLILCAVLFFVARNLFPALANIILVLACIAFFLIILIIILVIVFSTSKSKDKSLPQASNEATAALSKGRSDLMESRRLIMRIKNVQIRTSGEDICKTIDKILRTLKEQPEDIPSVRQFFNYYLPTLGKILSKYVQLEKSAIPADDVTNSVISCLGDIKTALEKQYTNLFEDDILDLSVEMEALTLNCKRDGLL